ncbi:MAG: hydroxymethylpyrimidine/phosphomethylpyrimidine kinase [gamma proteobacterium symbiont of Bathyaustriella thionipta]|nr:hydroxymethylpyrimidine/phosphomethylpyrimidine kinase [gamma proteobacterium symbiont of Bathyaustriella thionipta]MCU7950410.1 hydroxymethylpyrimidine/phosphomethylpyrimidine kinase [gamma proteobacterium symbiont of Bathyaustriella thionipta]MCU7953345.1 hydroxymethylpyrimidine/phosphomethylpyrimidine kinase [gamma proteobacterium symbiont of Bathyaustriella thionipta]MCU7956915.1 hydroxymethylpyrimidine/phosphomethylpyrimidine kinase [gamma proteobacterium symbiont of Bathyaustriella thio
MNKTPPVVLSFSGNDPTGGAGIQADIEAAVSMGARVAPVVTALTVQDTQNVKYFSVTDASMVSEQARHILEDMPIAAFKIGMVGSVENIAAIHNILHDYHEIPVIVDPIISAGGGMSLATEEMALAYSDLLFPFTNLVTPNSNEVRLLAPEADSFDSCAQELMDDGCEYVLLTGTHEGTEEVINTFYGHYKKIESSCWERLPHSYHGSGCTLTSAIACLVACGHTIADAVTIAQEYAWQSLRHGYQSGMGQHHPDRLYWTKSWTDN